MEGAVGRAGSDQRGQNTLEFALILPLLLLMLAGVIDLGRGLRSFLIITNAAQVGARYGSMSPSDTAGIQARAQNAVAGSGVTLSGVVTTYPNGNARGNPIRVTVSCQVNTILGALLGLDTLTLSSRVDYVII